MRKLSNRLVALVAVALLFAACGSSGSKSSTGTSASSGSSQSSSKADTSGDPDKASAAALTKSDLPAAFESKASTSSSSSDSESDRATKECFRQATGIDPSTLDSERTGKAEASFEKGSGVNSVSVKGEVEYYPGPELLTEQLAAFDKPETLDCLKQAFNNQVTSSGVSISNVDLKFSKLDSVGDEGGQLIINASLSATGSTVQIPLAVEVSFVRVGRVGLTATVTAIGETPDHDLAITALKAMAGRVQQ